MGPLRTFYISCTTSDHPSCAITELRDHRVARSHHHMLSIILFHPAVSYISPTHFIYYSVAQLSPRKLSWWTCPQGSPTTHTKIIYKAPLHLSSTPSQFYMVIYCVKCVRIFIHYMHQIVSVKIVEASCMGGGHPLPPPHFPPSFLFLYKICQCEQNLII